MEIISWGTRGSTAISNMDSVKAGGNTTCYEVISKCFPKYVKVMLDAGTGFVPATEKYLEEFKNGHKLKYTIFFTHQHYDHIIGLLMSPPVYIDQIPMRLYGPVEKGVGPEKMIRILFDKPFFPVDDKKFKHKMTFKSLPDYDVFVVAVHPIGGFTTISVDLYKTLVKEKKHLKMGRGKSFPISECMIISMVQTNHANANCISYRFEEKPTGKTFVFCTDHEDLAGIGLNLRNHLSEADLLVIDCQYDEKTYRNKASYGHGTPFGCMKHGVIGKVKKIGLTHHDPSSTDCFLNNTILAEARSALARIKKNNLFTDYGVENVKLKPEDIFLCCDYMRIKV